MSSTQTPERVSATSPLLRLGWRAAVIAACLGFAVLAACDVGVGSEAIESPNDITVGECLALGDDEDPGKVTASKVNCEPSDGLSFYAARTVAAEVGCEAANTSTLTFHDGRESLCLTPNFASGTCYQVPVGGDLSAYREVACDASAEPETLVVQTVRRGDGSIECDGEDVTWQFVAPQSIGYCLRPVV